MFMHKVIFPVQVNVSKDLSQSQVQIIMSCDISYAFIPSYHNLIIEYKFIFLVTY